MVSENLMPPPPAPWGVMILGPTGSGKTHLGHGVAQHLRALGRSAGLVNLDAFQFFQGFDIGTAKPTKAEQCEFPYKGLDIITNTGLALDANAYAAAVEAWCLEIRNVGQGIPVCLGGSGLYTRSLLHGLDPLPPRHDGLRAFLRQEGESRGWPALHGLLRHIDAGRAQELHPNDGVRIERALEIFWTTGMPPSQLRKRDEELHKQPLLRPWLVVHLEPEVEWLKSRLRLRVREMWDMGWPAEVQRLEVDTQGLGDGWRALGYAEVRAHLRGELTAAEAQERIATLNWQYAKRQMTWNAKEVCHLKFQNGAQEGAMERVCALLTGVPLSGQ